MRKWTMLLAALLAVLMLAGCKRSDVAQNFGQGLEIWRPDKQRDDSLHGASDIVEYDTPEFGDTLGFGMTAWPDDDALSIRACYAIDEFGQVEYVTADDWILVLRVAPVPTALAALYNEAHGHERQQHEVDGVDVAQSLSAEEGCALASWKKDDFTYTLHSNKKQGRVPDEIVDRLVQEVETARVEGADSGTPE